MAEPLALQDVGSGACCAFAPPFFVVAFCAAFTGVVAEGLAFAVPTCVLPRLVAPCVELLLASTN